MITIIIDGNFAFIDKETTIDFVLENSAFESSEGYSLQINFPLKDCPENQAIFGYVNLVAADIPMKFYNCEIICGTFRAQGAVSIMEVTEESVSAQFLLNVPSTEENEIVDNTLISDLDLGQYPVTDPKKITPLELWRYEDEMCFPWSPYDSDDVTNNLRDYRDPTGKWDEHTTYLTWQPKLLKVIERIADAIGYKIGLSWFSFIADYPEWKDAYICNTLPQTWEMPDYADALPHWSISEFFEKLGKFLGGQFTFDHVNKEISFFKESVSIETNGVVIIEDLIDQFSSSVSRDEEDADYSPIKKYRYKDDDSEVWKWLVCPTFMKDIIKRGKYLKFQTFDDLSNYIRPYCYWPMTTHRGNPSSEIFYVENIDTFFAMRIHVARMEAFGQTPDKYRYIKFGELQPINVFAPKDFLEAEDSNSYEDIEFVPVVTDWNFYGKMMQLPLSQLDGVEMSNLASDGETWTGEKAQTVGLWATDNNTIWQTLTGQTLVNSSEEDAKDEYFDRIYIGFYSMNITAGKPGNQNDLHPVTHFETYRYFDYTPNFRKSLMRLDNGIVGYQTVADVDPKIMYNFSFLSDTIPDVKAIFSIMGVNFICKKLTFTLTNNGTSKIIKGEFYRMK